MDTSSEDRILFAHVTDFISVPTADVSKLGSLTLEKIHQASTGQSAVDANIPFHIGSIAFAIIQLLGIIVVMSQVAWQDVIFGGTETVASAIEWAMAELMKHPNELRKVQDELTEVVGLDRKVHESDLHKLAYLKCTVKETLRLHQPVLLLHETTMDCKLFGYSIPARTRVIINTWAIGRDKTAWEDAEAFIPSRFTGEGGVDFKGNHFELIPFGSGRSSCPSMQLGIYALELALAQLLHCFTWTLPDGVKPSELDMSDVFGLTAPKAIRLSQSLLSVSAAHSSDDSSILLALISLTC